MTLWVFVVGTNTDSSVGRVERAEKKYEVE
jgi:hypothetical protein